MNWFNWISPLWRCHVKFFFLKYAVAKFPTEEDEIKETFTIGNEFKWCSFCQLCYYFVFVNDVVFCSSVNRFNMSLFNSINRIFSQYSVVFCSKISVCAGQKWFFLLNQHFKIVEKIQNVLRGKTLIFLSISVTITFYSNLKVLKKNLLKQLIFVGKYGMIENWKMNEAMKVLIFKYMKVFIFKQSKRKKKASNFLNGLVSLRRSHDLWELLVSGKPTVRNEIKFLCFNI